MKHKHEKKKEHEKHSHKKSSSGDKKHSHSTKGSYGYKSTKGSCGEKSYSCSTKGSSGYKSSKSSSGDKYKKDCKTNGAKWSALDSYLKHPVFFDDDNQEAAQSTNMTQASFEAIVVKDSADVEVHTTDTQAAVALHAALQAAISLVINVSIADSSTAEKITQELLQQANFKQTNVQKTYIENSRNVKVITTDTDLALSIQILIQVLLALVAELNIL